MKKITDIVNIPEIHEMKEKSLLSLSQEKPIKEFFKNNHIDTKLMNEYWVELLDYNDDYKTCQACSSLQSCPKDNQGIRKHLAYHDGEIYLELESCPFAKIWEEKRELLSQFEISNVNDDLMLCDMKDLSLPKKKKLTDNEKMALTQIMKYVKDPTDQGFFLHGEMGLGKTTLIASLMNALAKKGKKIGFIHFPTYLIDLKASFSTGDDQYAMERLMKVDCLFLDDIGEENVTAWSRDEILLTILSYRLLNRLPTFFTSMYGYKDLNKVYTIKKGDEIRANTLTSKMKALSIEIMLDGEKFR